MRKSRRESIYVLLRGNPPDLSALRNELDFGDYTPEQVTKAAIQYLDNCFDDQVNEDWNSGKDMEPDYFGRPVEEFLRPELRSAYIPEVLKLLLDYGLEPNAVYDDENVMHSLKYIENGYVAADALAILLEHGGDCRMQVDGETLFDKIDFDVIFDAINQENRRRYDALVHYWFVWLILSSIFNSKMT